MTGPASSAFSIDESFARRLDERDPLRGLREEFEIPRRADGAERIYFCGNSLGLQPRAAKALLLDEIEDWARLGVDGHFREQAPWYSYHELFRDSGARLVGARPGEVVMMNGLTANLHLMMVSFYRPSPQRHKILIEHGTFPSDLYAVRSQVAFHGYDPDEAVIVATPREGEDCLRQDDIESLLAERGREIALVMFAGVNYYTGQVFDLARITRAARRQGCRVGFDLAHATGNVPLELHDWDVDFAVWCSYKYLNAGPGAVAGCFVHERHGADPTLPRFAGWWGNDPRTRFDMHGQTTFVPRAGADGWQLSNPPILALAPLRASLALFDRAGMRALRAKSVQLTGYLAYLVGEFVGDRARVVTPAENAARGCQLSIRVGHDEAEPLFSALSRAGCVCDLRRPDVIRAAPVPLYNRFHEVWRFATALSRLLADPRAEVSA